MSSLQPKYLKGRDLEIFYRHLAGQSHSDIAADLGISSSTVSTTVNSDWFRNQLAEVHAKTIAAITSGNYSPLSVARAHANEAMLKNIELMRFGRNQKIQQSSAWDILDRAGYAAPKKTEHTNVNDMIEKMTIPETEEYLATGTIPESVYLRLSLDPAEKARSIN